MSAIVALAHDIYECRSPSATTIQARFVKTWIWAMPEKAQLVGLMLYRSVDDVTWAELQRDVPAIVPRGLPGYRRYF